MLTPFQLLIASMIILILVVLCVWFYGNCFWSGNNGVHVEGGKYPSAFMREEVKYPNLRLESAGLGLRMLAPDIHILYGTQLAMKNKRHEIEKYLQEENLL